MKRYLFPFIVIAFLCLSIPIEAKEVETGLNIGEKAPNFILKDLTGKTVQLADFKGQQIMINFWATWCPPCKKEMLDIERLSQEKKGQLIVLAINIDGGNDMGVREFVRARKLTYPILVDKNDEVANQYHILSIPTTYFVNRDGIITNKALTILSIEQMHKMLEESTK